MLKLEEMVVSIFSATGRSHTLIIRVTFWKIGVKGTFRRGNFNWEIPRCTAYLWRN